jgi:hypothetical protein
MAWSTLPPVSLQSSLQARLCSMLLFVLVLAGMIRGQVPIPSFAIAASDREAAKTSAAATFSFTPSAGAALATCSSIITLTDLSGFFATSGIPKVGITVTTSADTTASAYVASGVIGGACDAVAAVPFTIAAAAAADCVTVAAKTSVAATFAFTSTAGGALASGSLITLNYPNNFFATSLTPTEAVSVGASSGPIATSTTTTASNQKQTQHQLLLQAWQDKSFPPRPKNQGLLICSTAFELKSSTTCIPSPRVIQNHVAAKPHTTAVCEAHLIFDTIQQYLVHISDSKPFPFQLVKKLSRTRFSVPCTSSNPAPSTYRYCCTRDICVCTTHQGSIHVGFCCLCGCVKNMVEAPSHFRGLPHLTNAVHDAPSFEIGLTFLHLVAENLLVPVTQTFTFATPMPSDCSIFLNASNVVTSYFLKEKNQRRRCAIDDSAGQRLLVHFGSPLHFESMPLMSPTHCSDDVSTTCAKGKIESIAVNLIAHCDEDLWTGAKNLVSQTPHITRLTNALSGSRFVADHALPM